VINWFLVIGYRLLVLSQPMVFKIWWLRIAPSLAFLLAKAGAKTQL
jgi:hypothetical protein